MKKQQSLTEIYNGLEAIFNPPMNFNGSYIIDIDTFYDSSIVSNGHNLVKEYFEKHYFKHIKSAFPNIKMTNNPLLFLISDVNKNGYGRSLKPSLSLLVMLICHEITGEDFLPSENYDELVQEVKDYSRQFRKSIAAIERGEITEDNAKILEKLKKSYEKNENYRSKLYGKDCLPLPFDQFLKRKKESMISLSLGIKSLVPLFEKEINLTELSSCLQLDKFYLALMKKLIEITKLHIRESNHVHNSLVQVATYLRTVEDMRKHGPYDQEIYLQQDKRKIKYSIEDLINEYNEIRLKNPQFEIVELEVTPEKDLRDFNNALELIREMENLLKSKELKASWNFIRNGQLDKTQPNSHVQNSSPKKKKCPKSHEELVNDTASRISYLDSTRYLYKMSGKNNFDGYVGYIYENGCVIFEKFYRSQSSLEPARENATYIMSLSNFVEISKKTKTEIIDYIRHGATELRRIYHTSTWSNRIDQTIDSRTYNEETINRIESLINEGHLTKKIKKGK